MTQRQWCHRSRAALISPEKFSWTDCRYLGTEKYVRKVSLNSDKERQERHCIFRARSVSSQLRTVGRVANFSACGEASRVASSSRLGNSDLKSPSPKTRPLPGKLPYSSCFHRYGATLLQQFPYNAFMNPVHTYLLVQIFNVRSSRVIWIYFRWRS